MVIRTASDRARLEDFNRWDMPLQDNLAGVIADNLAALLGTPRVTRFPKTPAAQADFRVIVDVQRFESVKGESATLDAVWSVRRMRDGAVQTQRTSVSEPVLGESFEALAVAHSRAAARLSQDIARALQGMSFDTVRPASDMRS
jgi:uncharacterized lipoprotein YmbA